MSDGELDRAPIFTDVRELRAENFITKPDIIFGGFPCQDLSCAGKQKGIYSDRSGLFSEIARLTDEIKPRYVFLENVPAIRTNGLKQVVGAFASMGYVCKWTVVSARELGAPHVRKRWFLLADSNSVRKLQQKGCEQKLRERTRDFCEDVPNSDSKGLKKNVSGRFETQISESWNNRGRNWWNVEPDVGRVANGIPFNVDRIKSLGNACMPEQAKTAFERLVKD
jgi:DNA (cytosine-5)-methyltransferase 1